MRILFVQVPTSHLAAGERVYPLGLSRLSGMLQESRYEKSTLDMNLDPDPWPRLKEQLENKQPEVVALSFRNLDPLSGQQTSYLSSLKTAAQMVRSLMPKAIIVAGGPAFSLFGKRLMQKIPQIDLGVTGEGEKIFKHLLSSLSTPECVPGVIWRKGEAVRCNPLGPYMDMDSLPEIDTGAFCPQDYLKDNKYVAAMGIEGKRGCDLKCSYCVYPCLGGNTMRLRNPVKVVDEMEMLCKEWGVSLFHFTDSVLNRPVEHFQAICLELLSRKLKVAWTGFFREDTFTQKAADLAQRAGVVACYFSADALTDHGLKILKKGLKTEDILRAARVTAESNILTICHFLVNLPFETPDDFQTAHEMMDKILDIHGPSGNLGAVIFNNVRLYPGASLTQKLTKDKIVNSDMDFLYPVFYNPQDSNHVLHELEAKCHSAGVFSRLKISCKPVIGKKMK